MRRCGRPRRWQQQGLEFLEPQPPRGAVVSGFSPLADEFRVWPLLRGLAGEGYRAGAAGDAGQGQAAAVPRLDTWRCHGQGVWGIAEPKADKPALEPDILIVPLLAFDRAGWRLGYGGGFYDRTLRRPARAQGRSSPSASPSTSSRSTPCRISTMTSASTGCCARQALSGVKS